MNETRIVEFSQDELACRILEALVEQDRPSFVTATAMLNASPMRDGLRRAAEAAANYVIERIHATQTRVQ